MKESTSEEKARGKSLLAPTPAPAKNTTTTTTTQSVTFVRSNAPAVCDANGNPRAGESEWTFPPKAPTPHIYNCLSPVSVFDFSSSFSSSSTRTSSSSCHFPCRLSWRRMT